MSFQIRDFTSIAASMINHMRGVQSAVTDFNVGAVGRTMLESTAQEADQLYQDMFNAIRDAIPVATYESFNFGRLPAAPAAGVITVTIAASSRDVTIPAGTVFTPIAGGVSFTSQASVTIVSGGTTGSVSIVANQAGVAGNVPAATSFVAAPAPNNFVSAANAITFDSGRDLETPDEQQQRFLDYIGSLPRGTNDALAYGARTAALYNAAGIEIERVKCVSIVEPYLTDSSQPISLVEVYVHNGQGSTSSGLVALADKILRGYQDTATGKKVPGWKASGTHLVTAAATEVPVGITGAITLNPGYDGPTAISDATAVLERHLLELDNGAPSLYKDRVILVGDLPAVANIVFATATSDITCTAAQKLVPGTITLTAS
jgi:hypothetical protein